MVKPYSTTCVFPRTFIANENIFASKCFFGVTIIIFKKRVMHFALQATPVKSAHLHTFRCYYPLKKLLGLFYSPCCFWILNGKIHYQRWFFWMNIHCYKRGVTKSTYVRICIELQNYWRSVEMRTDTLKKESHIAFRHPISSFAPYSEKKRGGKL